MTQTRKSGSFGVKQGEELFRRLAVVFSDYKLFSPKHPRFLQSCESFVTAVEHFLNTRINNRPEQTNVLFIHRKGQVYFRRMPLTLLAPPSIKLAQLLEEKKVEGLRFGPGMDIKALTCLVGGLHTCQATEGEAEWDAVNRLLVNRGYKASLGLFVDRELDSFDSASEESTWEGTEPYLRSSILGLPQLSLPLQMYKRTLTALHDLMTLVGAGGNPTFDPILEIAGTITEGVIREEQSFLPLTSVQYTSQFTFNHSVNVCLLVTAALKPLVDNTDQLVRAGQAALLHDLGKSLLPEELFYMKGVPTDDEQALIENHPELGAEVLLDTPGVDPLAVVVAYDHHRRPGGTGYPSLKRDRKVGLLTSLIAAVDIFEALTAERPYKKSLSAAEAFQVFPRLPEAKGLEGAVRLLFDTLSPFPPGTFVELEGGEFAVVTQSRSRAPNAPCVRLVSGSGHDMVFASEEMDLEKLTPEGSEPPRIARALPSGWSPEVGEQPTRSDAEASEEDRELQKRIEEGTLLASEG